MRRKITFSFLGFIIISTLLILILTFLSMYFFVFSKNTGVSDYPPSFTLSFDKYIENKKVIKKGEQLLKNRDAWIQIFDTNGNEIYELLKPEDAPNHYAPAEIVHAHMYPNTINGYTLFIASTTDNNLNYIIGFPSSEISKHTFDYDSSTVTLIIKFTLMVLVISFFVFLLMGFIFGGKLTNPIVQIIEEVELLSDKKYWIQYEEKGLYSKVFASLNKLADNLKLSESEREKTEKLR